MRLFPDAAMRVAIVAVMVAGAPLAAQPMGAMPGMGNMPATPATPAPPATPATPADPAAGMPAMPASPVVPADTPAAAALPPGAPTVIDNTLPPPPASAMNKSYPPCTRMLRDNCQNPGEGGAPGRDRASHTRHRHSH